MWFYMIAMAFSLFQGYEWLFGVIAILFVIGVFYYRSMGAWNGDWRI
ncbi:hypothetical protein [Paenibacillus etheri]|nr:hypothetical protein [Paenibacillus etheri]